MVESAPIFNLIMVQLLNKIQVTTTLMSKFKMFSSQNNLDANQSISSTYDEFDN